MSSRSRLLSGVSTAWFSLGTLAILQISQVRLAREYLPNDEFAVFGLISSVIASLMIAEFGIRSAFARLLIDAMNHTESDYRRFWSSTVAVFVTQALIILVAALVCLPFLSVWFSIPPATVEIARRIFLAQAALTSLQYAFAHHSVALMATQRFAFLNLSATVASIIGAIMFWWSIGNGFGLWSYIILSGPGVLLACVVYPIASGKAGLSRRPSRADISGQEIRRIFSLGFDLFIVALYNLALVNASLLFAGAMLPLAIVSVLTVNLKFVQLLTQALQRIPGTADPILSKMIASNDLAGFRTSWTLVSKCTVGLSALCVGMTYLWAGTAVALWTSQADVLTGAELLLVALMPLRYTMQMVYVLSPTMFKAANRLRTAMLAELVVYCVMAFALGRSMGLKGILLANIVSLFAGSLVPGLLLMSRLSHGMPSAFMKAAFRTIIPGFAAATALALLVPRPELQTIPERTLWTAVWCLLIAIGFWFLNLSDEERNRISGAFTRRARQSNP